MRKPLWRHQVADPSHSCEGIRLVFVKLNDNAVYNSEDLDIGVRQRIVARVAARAVLGTVLRHGHAGKLCSQTFVPGVECDLVHDKSTDLCP